MRTPYDRDPIDYRFEDGQWRLGALCAEVDTAIFFPEKGASTKDALSLCSSCLVRKQCLAFAVDGDERWGVWGGTTPQERRKTRAPATPDSANVDEVIRLRDEERYSFAAIGSQLGIGNTTARSIYVKATES